MEIYFEIYENFSTLEFFASFFEQFCPRGGLRHFRPLDEPEDLTQKCPPEISRRNFWAKFFGKKHRIRRRQFNGLYWDFGQNCSKADATVKAISQTFSSV